MPRAKRGFKARRRRQRVLQWAKGFRGRRNRCYKIAHEAVMHAWVQMYRGRKQRKRDFRALWIIRINAAARTLGTTYSGLMHALKQTGIELDRKSLAEIAIHDPV